MKKIIYSIALSMAFIPVSAGNRSSLSFDTYEWDFGAIDAAKGAVCHTFTFKNVSKAPVRIAKTNASCDCITALYPSNAIKPGEEAKVMVAFSPKKASGKTYRSVELIDAEGNTLGALSAKAVVGEANSVVAQQDSKYKYPFQNPSLSREERVENLISLLTFLLQRRRWD